MNSALLEVNDKNSTENSEESIDGKYGEFRNDHELLLAEVGYMIAGTKVEDDYEEENREELHIPEFHWLGTRLASITDTLKSVFSRSTITIYGAIYKSSVYTEFGLCIRRHI